MNIASVVLTHGHPELTADTVNALEHWVGDRTLVLVDEAGWSKFENVRVGSARIEQGFRHAYHRNVYRNSVLALQKAYGYWPDSDWFLYTEYDCLFLSDTFKTDLVRAREQGAWMAGLDLRRFDFKTPLFQELLDRGPIRHSYYFLGCCYFLSREFLAALMKTGFIDRLLEATRDFDKSTFPGYPRWSFEEELWGTAAVQHGGKLYELACWKSPDKQWHPRYPDDSHLLYADGEHDQWRGRYPVYSLRFSPEIGPGEVSAETSIAHPSKSLGHPVRAAQREKRMARIDVTPVFVSQRNGGPSSVAVAAVMPPARKAEKTDDIRAVEQLYRQMCGSEVSDAALLCFFGTVANRAGRHDLAAELLGRGLEANSGSGDSYYQLGVALQAADKLDQAAASFKHCLSLTPDHADAGNRLSEVIRRGGKPNGTLRNGGPSAPWPSADAHYQQGLSHAKQNKLAEAEASFRQAIRLKPDLAEAHDNLGVVLSRLRRLPEAEAAFRLAVQLKPHSAAAHANLGMNLLERHKWADAEMSLRQAILLHPESADSHANLAAALAAQGRPSEAEPCMRESLRLKPDQPEVHYRLGSVLRSQSKNKEAETCFREATRLEPRHVDAQNSLGILLEEQGRAADAVIAYQEALRSKPDVSEIHSNLGIALAALDRLEEAEKSYREALRLQPASAAAHNNLGNCLRMLGRLDDSEASLREAIRLNPGYPEAHNNLGIVFIQRGQRDQAVTAYEEALRLRSDYPEAHLNRALAWLGAGDFDRGWSEYEWRWKGKAFKPRKFDPPLWDGSSLKGRTILLHTEQGLGDGLQFIRYAPLIRAEGTTVLAECPEALVDLFRTCPGVDQVVQRGKPIPKFDVHAPLLTLPGLLGTRLDNIPANVPYLHPDPARVAHWARELAGAEGFRVGIVWQGNPQHKGDRQRSIKLAMFEPLAGIPGVRLCAIQKGPGREQIDQLRGKFAVEDCGNALQSSMADTAGLMQNLDLVLTVDTAVAHLAGALGLPAWVLLPYAADWRWLRDREDSPWYPSLRLFRQGNRGDWNEVFDRVAAELRSLAEKPRPSRPAAPQPSTAEEHHQLGMAHFRRGQHEQAIAAFREALQLKPNALETHNALGVALAKARRQVESVPHFQKALAGKPDSVAILGNLGLAHLELGKKEEAEKCYRELVRLKPDWNEAHWKLANVFRNQGKLKEAEATYREAVRLRPQHADAYNSLGIVLEELGRAGEAEKCYRDAIQIQPQCAEMHSNLGVALAAQDRMEEAEKCYRESLRLKPDSSAARNNLGNCLRVLGQLDESEASLREAIRLSPSYGEAHNNLGVVKVQQGKLDEGVELYTEALRLRPDYPEAHLNRALAWLGAGDFDRGWSEYEWRWKGKAFKPRKFDPPLWDGSSLKGRTILLHTEQGLGDGLQFIRYAPLIRAEGTTVLAECPEALVDLFRTCPGVDQVVQRGKPIPKFDVHAPLLTLPGLLGTRLDNIPANVPYLRPDPARVAHSARELAGVEGFRVGIVWQGNPQHKGDRQRSVKLERFAALAAIPGVKLCSVQKGAGREQIEHLRGKFAVEDCGNALQSSMADTAGLLKNLDLLVTVDTAVAHLAGALGLTVWVMLPFAADWRWLRHREDSPWYPSMRLFRPPQPGMWEPVFQRVVEELTPLAAGSKPERPKAPEPATAREYQQQGLSLFKRGRFEQAAESFEKAVRLDPNFIDARNGLGVAKAKLGKQAEAIPNFQFVLQHKPDSVAVLGNLGLAHGELNQKDEAEKCYRELARLQPDSAEARLKLAHLLRHRGKVSEAVTEYREVVRLRPNDADTYNSLGILLEEMGQPVEAVKCYREAIRINPSCCEIHSNLGVALAAMDKLDESAACYREAIRLKPESAIAHNNLGNALRKLGQIAEAETALREAVRLRPDYAEAHNNLGIILVHQRRTQEGVASYEEALRRRPEYAEAHNNLAIVLADSHRYDEALVRYDEAVRLKPDYAEAHLNRALCYLGGGDFERGWPEYEWRWKGKTFKPRKFDPPLWDGSSLKGRTILLHTEQGLGDAIQFIRYAPLIRSQGATVLVECPEPLAELFRRCPGVEQVIVRGSPLPSFDVHVPMMSIPGLVGTRLETIPSKVPYLDTDPARVAHWRKTLAGLDGFRVGVVWQGNKGYKGDTNRSVKLAQLEPLAAVPGVRLCSLQKDFGSEQIAELGGRFAVENLGARIASSFADTAALIENLDLVISVDTAVGHLTGALGLPVWLLTPFASDWRWLRKREDSPWYPTMRLFRQSRAEIGNRRLREWQANWQIWSRGSVSCFRGSQ